MRISHGCLYLSTSRSNCTMLSLELLLLATFVSASQCTLSHSLRNWRQKTGTFSRRILNPNRQSLPVSPEAYLTSVSASLTSQNHASRLLSLTVPFLVPFRILLFFSPLFSSLYISLIDKKIGPTNQNKRFKSVEFQWLHRGAGRSWMAWGEGGHWDKGQGLCNCVGLSLAPLSIISSYKPASLFIRWTQVPTSTSNVKFSI